MVAFKLYFGEFYVDFRLRGLRELHQGQIVF